MDLYEDICLICSSKFVETGRISVQEESLYGIKIKYILSDLNYNV